MERCEVCKTRTVTRDGVCSVCSSRPKDRVRRRHWLLIPAVTWAALLLTWLGLLGYVLLVDLGHPGGSSGMTSEQRVNWANRAMLVMLTGQGRSVDSPPELAVGLALIGQLAFFLLASAGILRVYSRRVQWSPRWREVLPGVLIASIGVGLTCVMLARAVVPALAPWSAFAVPTLFTAAVLFSALWPAQRSRGDVLGRIGAGIRLAWQLFAFSLLPGVLMFVVGIQYFYGSWSGLHDLWGLYLFNSIPQDLVGAAAFTFGGLHDGFSGRTGLFTGDMHWGYQVFPFLQVALAFLIGHRFVLRRRRGTRIGLELICAGLTMILIWTAVIWHVHFHADPRQYTKYTLGWGPLSISSLASMAVMIGLVFITLSFTRGRLAGWSPRVSAFVAGSSMHPTWAAALTQRMEAEGTRIPRRLRRVEISEEDRGGAPLLPGALGLLGAAGFGTIALALLLIPSQTYAFCGNPIQAAYMQPREVPDHQAPPQAQARIDRVVAQLDKARIVEVEALERAATGRELMHDRRLVQQRFEQATREVSTVRGQLASAVEYDLDRIAVRNALDTARADRADLASALRVLDRSIAREQQRLDEAAEATAEVRRLIGVSVRLENAWRSEHMAEYIAAVDHNAQAEICQAEGQSRLLGAGIFGAISVLSLWFWWRGSRGRRRVAAATS